LGYLYALLAALLFGANGSVTKVILDAGLSATQLTQFRVLGTAVIAGLLLLLLDRSGFRLPLSQLAVMALLGIFGVALLQASYAAAVALLPVGIALLLEYLAVLMVASIAFFFLRERVRRRLWVAIGCVLVGLALVAEVWASRLDQMGVALALFAAVALTVYFLVGERQVQATSALAVAFWTMTFATVFWAFLSGWWELQPGDFAQVRSLGGSLSAIAVPLWVPVTWNVVLGSFAPFLLSFLALRQLSATAAGVVAASEVIFAFLVAWLWLGERLGTVQLIGAAVVLAGIVLAQTSRGGKVVDADLALELPARADVGGSA
jgi:drug/metabolite transporter (DMT)-like permease